MKVDLNQTVACIYMLISPSGKKYIGQTINLKNRMQKYAYNDSRGQVAIYRAIKKYGWENFDVDILLEVKRKDKVREILNIFEYAFIKKFNTVYPYGYNLTTGGDHSELSAHSKEKIRLANLGRKQTDAAKRNMSISGLNMDINKREKINNAIRSMSLEARERINTASRISKSVKIHQYSIDGVLLNTYNSIKEASIATGILTTGIGVVLRCHRNRETAGGYVWKYDDDEKINISQNNKIYYSKIIRPRSVLKREILQFNQHGLFICKFDSIKDASIAVGVAPNAISSCLAGITKLSAGYKWIYKYPKKINKK